MDSTPFTSGNAAEDPDRKLFRSWFVGDVRQWAQAGGSQARPEFGHRQSQVVEMKWGVHAAGEEREAWAPVSDQTTMSLLVRGKFLLRFRSPARPDAVIEHWLKRESDYVIWTGDWEHTWLVEEDAVIFTVRWTEKSGASQATDAR